MISLAVDIGNSVAKAAVFYDRELQTVAHKNSRERLSGWLEELAKTWAPEVCGVVATGRKKDELRPNFPKQLLQITRFLTGETPAPFVVAYRTRATLGADRLAAIAGAFSQVPDASFLVIDAGTALTIDAFQQEKGYSGGIISPGMQMRFQALHRSTANLPLVEPQPMKSYLGTSTAGAIRTGVMRGMIGEMQYYITHYRKSWGANLKVFLTGGDTQWFENHLKNVNFVEPLLVLTGIRELLLFND